MDKSKAQPQQQRQQQQQQDPNSAEAPSTPISSETPKPEDNSSVTSIGTSAPSQNSKEKMQMESPILPGLSFHQPQQEPAAGTSLSPSFGSTWSTGTTNTVDDSFFQGITPVNGTMLFQNFPHHVNPVFGGTFSPQIGLAQTQHHQHQQQQQQAQQQQQQRRSPVSPNQAPFAQRNAA